MLKKIPTAYVADKIDWENKIVTGQMENANSILIQHINDSDTRNSLKTDRKQHRSYKGK